MKKKHFTLLMALLMTGAPVFTSCDSDDDMQTETAPAETAPDYLSQINDVNNRLQDELSAVNLDELAPLTRAVAEACDCDCEQCTNGDGCEQQKFSAWLSQLLQQLNADFSRDTTYQRIYSYSNVAKMLTLVWTYSGSAGYGRQQGQLYANTKDTVEFSAQFPTADGLYNVSLSRSIAADLGHLRTNGPVTRTLSIVKDGAPVLSIESTHTSQPSVLPFLPAKSLENTGTIKISGISIALGYSREDAHSRDITLQVASDEEVKPLVVLTLTLSDNMSVVNQLKDNVVFTADLNVSLMGGDLGVVGQVKNINRMAGESVSLAFIQKNGSTQEKCDALTAKFNDNMSLHLIASGTDVGTILLMTKYDEEKQNYTVGTFLQSPLFGEEPLEVSAKLIESFGISLDDMKDMIIKAIGEKE